MPNQEYQLIRSRRRTLALEIARDAALIVRAPLRMPVEFVLQFVEQKRGWIDRKQRIARERAGLASQLETRSSEEIRKLREQAEQKLCARAQHFANLMDVKYGSLRITRAKTRWGSCTRAANISLSLRLILAPERVIDYVIVHELAHILEHNHSKKFWQKVEQFYPEYKKCRKWLRENDHLLVI